MLLAPVGKQADAAQRANGKSGVLKTAAGNYKFTPTTCAISKEDGVDDVEIGGRGKAPDGEPFYFELSSTGNALSLGLGADGPFVSANRKLQAGRYVSQELAVEVSGRKITVQSLKLVDESGQRVDDDATLTIDCEICVFHPKPRPNDH